MKAKVRLIREVNEPGNCGPRNGQYALQKALRAVAPPWLAIGGRLREHEIPWFWSWEDRLAAAACATAGRPFVIGPNVLFAQSRRPCCAAGEETICQAASCRLIFTESAWYRRLIRRHQGPANRAPIVVWPYPIDPQPAGPLPPRYDLLIYAKSGFPATLIPQLRRRGGRVCVLVYGRFQRQMLFEAARRSRCCLYLSDDDRGPLALAEILLAGCPAVGLPTGAPFIQAGQTGVFIDRFHPQRCLAAVDRCWQLERQAVAARAHRRFETRRITAIVLGALQTLLDPPLATSERVGRGLS